MPQPSGPTAAGPPPEFTPIHPNPYIVGNPVRGRSMFFGREAEFELVQRRFQNAEHGALLVFCGERRSGKTSILFQILDRRLGPAFIPVLIDMQSMAVTDDADFLGKIAGEIRAALGPEARDLRVPDFAAGTNPMARFQDFVATVLQTHPGRKLLLLFDEYELFETKIESGILGEDVLHALAGLMEKSPVFAIFTGSQHLEQRRREYWKILGRSIYKTVSYLDRDDAVQLIRKPVEGRVEYAPEAVDAIWRLTAGQAFYIQAICQNLVDHLNEIRRRDVDRDLVFEVVQGIVDNPLPQMIFLWDSLDRDDKLVLALLAETLHDDTAYASVRQVARTIGASRYPLELETGRIATSCEKLFKSEFLLKESTEPPSYAFRMDLWRLWIRRMHSVWQVMREEGLALPRRGSSRGRWALAAAVAGAAAAAVVLFALGRRSGSVPTAPPAAVAMARLALRVEPSNAWIRMDGRSVGIGAFEGDLAANVEHDFVVAAAGCADSTFAIRLADGEAQERTIVLRPLRGDVHIVTEPPGAEIRIDGAVRGRSPLLVSGLVAARALAVEAALAGRQPARVTATPLADTMITVSIALAVGRAALVVTTDPPGAEIRVDGGKRGTAPVQLADLTMGRHRFEARSPGFASADTTVEVGASTAQLHLRLRREAPGVLIVQGDHPAEIWVDGVLVRENVQNSGPQPLAGGSHRVRVRLVSGDVIEATVEVRTRERVVFDYTTQQVVGRAPLGGEP
jgi:hypothetical protein